MADARTGTSIGGESTQTLTAEAIAAAVGGTLSGDGTAEVFGVAPLHRAQAHHLSFLANAKYAPLLATGNTGVLLVSPALAETPGPARARVVVSDPHGAMLSLLARLHPAAQHAAGIHPTAVLGKHVQLGDRVAIGPHVVLGDHVRIGDDTRLHAGVSVGDGAEVGEQCELYESVTLYPGASLGDRVRVHAGARIGCDGFGYVSRSGAHEKIPHVGRCVIESDVEIGANTTIDRGSIDDTVIGAGTKIDNLVHIAHNVRVGRLCLIIAQVGISGSVVVEDGCIIAGQAGIAGHLTIGAGARLAGRAGVIGDIPAGETWSGYPARPHREALKAQAALFRLPALLRAIERLVGDRSPGEPR